MENYIPKGWECTDPDMHQYCKKLWEGCFKYRQLTPFCLAYTDENFLVSEKDWEDDDLWDEMIIDYSLLSGIDIQESIRPFGYKSIADIRENYSDDYKQIICECYFEMNI